MITLWQPQEGPQTAFCKARSFEVLYGGSKGGGKSDGILFEGLRQTHIPQYRAIIFRREYDQLTKIIERSQEIFPQLGADWKDYKKTWVFPSGSKYYLRQMEHEKDKAKYDGQEFHYMGFDELTHFTDTMYLYMIGMCRTSHPDIIPRVRASAMPIGIGLGWVKQRFIDNGPFEIVTDEHGLTRQFIPARLEDNKILMANDPMYDARLRLMGPKLYKSLRQGDWDSIEGAAFEELDKTVHMRQAHIPVNPALIWRALDWGYAKPFSVGWYYEDFDGNVTRFKEWYGWNGKADTGLRMDSGEVAKGIIEMEKCMPPVSHGVADPSIWSKVDGSPSIAENMKSEGVLWRPAVNDRIQGKMELHGRLKEPSFFVTEDCKQWWRCLPMLQGDPRKPEDVDTKAEEHNYDETRYALMDRPRFYGKGQIILGEDTATANMDW